MRFVVYGAGAVGGVVGARLAQHGHDVALIARGAHLDAIRERGLRIEDPDGSAVLRLAAAGHPGELGIGNGDVVLLAMKTQDTWAALQALAPVAAPTTPVVCVQNAVENERLAARLFSPVYGVSVMCPTEFLEPGVVRAYSAPLTGTLDIGRYPAGVDELAQQIASAFTASQLPSEALPEIMRWKYRKLIRNLGNAVEAVCGPIERGSTLLDLIVSEAETVLAAAGIDPVPSSDDTARRESILTMRPIGGERRRGGSSWQSLERGAGGIEADFLNGEIVLLGRLHGVETPANETIRRLANELAANGRAPGAMAERDVLARIDARLAR